MEEPANTLNYMLAGYGVIFGAILFYVISLVLRYHHLRHEEKIFKEYKKE